MKVTGFSVLVLIATLLAPAYSAPSPILPLDPITSTIFTAAGGLVLTTASGAITIPTISLLAGKAIAIKGLYIAHQLHKANQDNEN